jgi:hypothetical protein
VAFYVDSAEEASIRACRRSCPIAIAGTLPQTSLLQMNSAEKHLMAGEIEGLVLEHLRAIRANIADIKPEVTAKSLQLTARGQHLAGLTAASYGSSSDVVDIRRRLGPSE